MVSCDVVVTSSQGTAAIGYSCHEFVVCLEVNVVRVKRRESVGTKNSRDQQPAWPPLSETLIILLDLVQSENE